MKNYPNEIKLMILVIATFSFGVVTERMLIKYDLYRHKSIEGKSFLQKEFGDEYCTITLAAFRNDCYDENLLILFAIRKAENGPPGNEFGIECQSGTDLDTQAGWAAATIMKNRERWGEGYEELFGIKGFIVFLSRRYCPLNSETWAHNVWFWFERFKENEL